MDDRGGRAGAAARRGGVAGSGHGTVTSVRRWPWSRRRLSTAVHSLRGLWWEGGERRQGTRRTTAYRHGRPCFGRRGRHFCLRWPLPQRSDLTVRRSSGPSPSLVSLMRLMVYVLVPLEAYSEERGKKGEGEEGAGGGRRRHPVALPQARAQCRRLLLVSEERGKRGRRRSCRNLLLVPLPALGNLEIISMIQVSAAPVRSSFPRPCSCSVSGRCLKSPFFQRSAGSSMDTCSVGRFPHVLRECGPRI